MKKSLKYIKGGAIIVAALTLFIIITSQIVIRKPQFGRKPTGQHFEEISKSPQHNGANFQNPGNVDVHMSFMNFMRMIAAFWNAPSNKKPSGSLPILHPRANTLGFEPDSVTMLTWFGHSAFLLEMGGKSILLDPMLGPAASPFTFFAKRFERELAVAIDSLPPIDAVILSHDHYDHLDYPSILALNEKVRAFYVPLGLGSHLRHWGVDSAKIHEMDWWEETEFEGLKFICTPSQHFSGRSTNDRLATLWSSWVIVGKQDKVFFSGDSGFFPGFKLIGEKYGPFDIALIECGQYNELWQEIHMLPEESAQAGVDLNAKQMMPIHWGMFDLSLHEWTEPVTRVSLAAASLNLPLVTPKIGERFSINEPGPNLQWWLEVK